MSNTTYLFSSFLQNPEFFFQGYCFIGSDYIYGYEGAKQYVEKTGNEVGAGEDGCYVTAQKKGEEYLFGSDNSGYKKILYYKDEITGVWVVSNSLYLIINHLSDNGISVTPNIPNLLALSNSPTPSQQPLTFITIANEIKLLPLNTILLIGDKTLKVKKLNKYSHIEEDYESLLRDFVKTWSSRIATILSSPNLVIEQALTGGVDSRSVLSLTEISRNALNNEVLAEHYLICGLTRGDTRDIDVAQLISDEYGYTLNPDVNKHIGRIKLNSLQRYNEWKDICLGLYAPIYFPSQLISPYHTLIGGGGGENHRPFYANYLKSSDFKSLINSVTKGLKNKPLAINLKNNLHITSEILKRIGDIENDDLLVAHYKNFRNRFHIGLFPQYRVTFTPLSSYLLDKLVAKGNMDKVRSSQLLYDLMSLVEGLIDIPFDSVEKKATEEQLQNLVTLKDSISIEVGHCYIDSNTPKLDTKPEKALLPKPIDYLKQDFDLACESEIVNELWDETTINSARKVMEHALEVGKLPYAADGRSISVIIATALFGTKNNI